MLTTNYELIWKMRKELEKQIGDGITEKRMDRIMDEADIWSRILAWAAVAAAVIIIILPALMAAWIR